MPPEDTRLELGMAQNADAMAHVETYRHFTRAMIYAALAVPAFFAFVLYWTT